MSFFWMTAFTNAAAQPPSEAPLGWGYELGYTSANRGNGLRFLVESESLLLRPHSTEARKDSYSVIAGSESLSLSGETVGMAALGLRIRRVVEGYENVSYLDVSALYTVTDANKLFPEAGIWGSRVSFGFDLPYAQYQRSGTNNGHVYGYLFVEGGWLIGFPKASEVTGRPDLVNGIHVTAGFKARYF